MGPDAPAFEIERLDVAGGSARVVGRWFGVRGRRFVRPALILTGEDGVERRLLAELEDKPWAAEDGETWRATFAVESKDELATAARVELSVAPDVNVELRSGGATAEGPIAATGRVSEATGRVSEAPAATDVVPEGDAGSGGTAAPAPTEVPGPIPQRHQRARGAPAAPSEGATPSPAPLAPRPRPAAQSRAADVERLTARLRAAEASLEREQHRREEADQLLEHERSDARRMSAELARLQAELELARAAEREAADTATQLDAARRDNHELRARHESLRADHDQLLHARADLEDGLARRTAALNRAREELAEERRQRQEAEARAAAAAEAAAPTGHRPPVVHATPRNPPLPRTDRPLNPSLRQNTWLRLLVVIVIAGVLLAVYLVLHSTVLH